MKLLFTIICIFFVFTFAKAQHVIVTKTDTIEAQIISLDDSIYTYKRLNKPRIIKTIDKNLVVRLVPLGNDTLYNIFKTIHSEIAISNSLFNDTTKSVLYLNNEIKTQAYWLDKAGFQMNTAVTLNILGTICLAVSPLLVRYNTVEKVYHFSNGSSSTFPVTEVDYTLTYVSIGAGIILNIVSLTYWYECSNSLKEAGKPNKISYKISPLGANIAYRF
ncbi:MAG: hypothetical protein ACOYMA_15115 [Bacteroidia bacterium]